MKHAESTESPRIPASVPGNLLLRWMGWAALAGLGVGLVAGIALVTG